MGLNYIGRAPKACRLVHSFGSGVQICGYLTAATAFEAILAVIRAAPRFGTVARLNKLAPYDALSFYLADVGFGHSGCMFNAADQSSLQTHFG